MLTLYGKALRTIRLNKNELLKDMASKLNITSAYLSSIENGKRAIPNHMTEFVVQAYKLDPEVTLQLEKAEAETRSHVQIDFHNANTDQRETVLKLARQFSTLSDEQFAEIKKILDRGDE